MADADPPKTNDKKRRGWVRGTIRARLAYAAIALWWLLSLMLLAMLGVCLTDNRGLRRFVELGLLQPMLAALLALVIVMGIWVAKGRYVDERRKGVSSASSSAIAVRLWALCFVLLFGAMIIAALLTSIQSGSVSLGGASKSTGAQIEVKSDSTSNGNSTSIKVTR